MADDKRVDEIRARQMKKQIKAWAIVGDYENRRVIGRSGDLLPIYAEQTDAEADIIDKEFERVVPVTITIEEEQ